MPISLLCRPKVYIYTYSTYPFFPGVAFPFQAHLSTAVFPCANTSFVLVLCYSCIKTERAPSKKLLAPPTYFSMSQTVGTKSFSLNMLLLSKKLCLEKSMKHFNVKTQHFFRYETRARLNLLRCTREA